MKASISHNDLVDERQTTRIKRTKLNCLYGIQDIPYSPSMCCHILHFVVKTQLNFKSKHVHDAIKISRYHDPTGAHSGITDD